MFGWKELGREKLGKIKVGIKIWRKKREKGTR